MLPCATLTRRVDLSVLLEWIYPYVYAHRFVLYVPFTLLGEFVLFVAATSRI